MSPPPYASEKLKDFGLSIRAKTTLGATLRSFFPDGDTLLLGNDKGEVIRFALGKESVLWKSPAKRPITVIHAADLNGDRINEIIAGDDSENLYAISPLGILIWSAKLTKYMGESGSAVDIAVGGPDPGNPHIFVASAGFKLCAFDRNGRRVWEQLIRYHLQTKVRLAQEGQTTWAAVGTVYSTPLNVLDAMTGKVRWFTWDQVGDEMSSTTDYCGVHLIDMIFLDADGDGSMEIVFGTKYNRVYALRLEDGSTVWEANVGDEVSALKRYTDPASGKDLILAGTEAGDLVVLDGRGRRIRRIELESAIVSLEIAACPEEKRINIFMATREGRVFVLSGELSVIGSHDIGEEISALVNGRSLGPQNSFLVLAARSIYALEHVFYSLRKSRFY